MKNATIIICDRRYVLRLNKICKTGRPCSWRCIEPKILIGHRGLGSSTRRVPIIIHCHGLEAKKFGFFEGVGLAVVRLWLEGVRIESGFVRRDTCSPRGISETTNSRRQIRGVNLEEGCGLLYDRVLLLGESIVSITITLEPFGCVTVRQARTGCSPFSRVVLNFIGQLSADLGGNNNVSAE